MLGIFFFSDRVVNKVGRMVFFGRFLFRWFFCFYFWLLVFFVYVFFWCVDSILEFECGSLDFLEELFEMFVVYKNLI